MMNDMMIKINAKILKHLKTESECFFCCVVDLFLIFISFMYPLSFMSFKLHNNFPSQFLFISFIFFPADFN